MNDWIVWGIILTIGLIYELYGIIWNRTDTLSEKMWYLIQHRSWFRVFFIALFLWLALHIGIGHECPIGEFPGCILK